MVIPCGRRGARLDPSTFRGLKPLPPPAPPPRSLLPTSPEMGLEEEEQGSKGGRAGPERAGVWGDTHRKRHCSWSCDSKKHRMPSSPPAIVATVVAAAAAWPAPGRGGGRPKVQPLILDFEDCHSADNCGGQQPPPLPSLLPITLMGGSFLHMLHASAVSLAQIAPPPGSPPTLHVGQVPTLSLHSLSGFPPSKP